MKKRNNQSGIAHIALILIIVLIAGLGFAGWRVYTVNQENKKLKDTASKTETKPASKEEAPKSTIPEGFVEYENKELGYKFVYPKTWQLIKNAAPQHADTSISLRTTDFKEQETEFGGAITVKGANVNITVSKTNGKTLDQRYNIGLTADLIKNGLKVSKTQTNGKETVEFPFAYEIAAYQEVYVLLSNEKYLNATMSSEGAEVQHPEYSNFKKTIESITLL